MIRNAFFDHTDHQPFSQLPPMQHQQQQHHHHQQQQPADMAPVLLPPQETQEMEDTAIVYPGKNGTFWLSQVTIVYYVCKDDSNKDIWLVNFNLLTSLLCFYRCHARTRWREQLSYGKPRLSKLHPGAQETVPKGPQAGKAHHSAGGRPGLARSESSRSLLGPHGQQSSRFSLVRRRGRRSLQESR